MLLKEKSIERSSLFIFSFAPPLFLSPPISYLPFISVLSLFIRLLLFHSVINTFTCSRPPPPRFIPPFSSWVQSLFPPLFFVYDRIFLVIEAFRFSLCIPFHYWRLYSSSSSSRNLDSPLCCFPFSSILLFTRYFSLRFQFPIFVYPVLSSPPLPIPPAVSFLFLILIFFCYFYFVTFTSLSLSLSLLLLFSSTSYFIACFARNSYFFVFFSRKIKIVSNCFFRVNGNVMLTLR